MMTENQLEIAAREYCRLAEMDAEKKVPTSPSPNPDGSVNMVCIWVPAWKAVAEMVAQQDMVRHCIDLANDERRHPYQRARASITGLGL